MHDKGKQGSCNSTYDSLLASPSPSFHVVYLHKRVQSLAYFERIRDGLSALITDAVLVQAVSMHDKGQQGSPQLKL